MALLCARCRPPHLLSRWAISVTMRRAAVVGLVPDSLGLLRLFHGFESARPERLSSLLVHGPTLSAHSGRGAATPGIDAEPAELEPSTRRALTYCHREVSPEQFGQGRLCDMHPSAHRPRTERGNT
jgi:hypothetical protein